MTTRPLTKPTAKSQVFDDGDTLTIIDEAACYLYHKVCGGLLMVHPLEPISVSTTFREVQMISRGLILPCRCYRPAPEETYTVQQLLTDIYMALAQCETVADVRLMIKEMSSREEMREYQQL